MGSAVPRNFADLIRPNRVRPPAEHAARRGAAPRSPRPAPTTFRGGLPGRPGAARRTGFAAPGEGRRAGAAGFGDAIAKTSPDCIQSPAMLRARRRRGSGAPPVIEG